MELSVMQNYFAKALNATSRVAGSRSTKMPILNNILLRTDNGRLLVGAMNTELASVQYIGAKIEKAGSITVPARLITDFVSNLPNDKIELKVKGERLHIKSGKYSSVLNGTSDEDYPVLPVMEEDKAISYTITPDDFKKTVSQTKVATGKDPARPILNGVYWHSIDGELYLAGTDGYRLAQKCLTKTKSDIKAIIPTTSLDEVLHLITESTSEIVVFFDSDQVRFKVDEAEVTSQLIDGNFPPYQQLIPQESNYMAKINKSDFSRIVKIAGLFARDSGGSITLEVSEENQNVTLKSVASELGENISEATAEVVGSSSITLNSKYLSEALSNIDGDTIEFGFNGKMAPIKLSSTDKKDKYIHIIMPIKS